MKSSWRLISVLALLMGISLESSCANGKLRAGGFTDFDLDGLARVRLPDTLVRVPSKYPKLLGISVGQELQVQGEVSRKLLDMNLWSVSHVFAFMRNGQEANTSPALLVISRLADQQAFASAQGYYEHAARIAGNPRWQALMGLEWKQTIVSRTLSFQQAEVDAAGPGPSFALVMSDRENLLQAILLSDAKISTPEDARSILIEASRSYRLLQPLESYFFRVGKVVQQLADLRRKNYVALLQVLQKEELDYAPTPKVVIFNANLACQFAWPHFDRSGVPSDFAIVGRLGKVTNMEPKAWKTMEESLEAFPGISVFRVAVEGEKRWRPTMLAGSTEDRPLATVVVQDTSWLNIDEGPSGVAFASLEFSFNKPIPDLSLWLDSIEMLEKAARARNLIEPI